MASEQLLPAARSRARAPGDDEAHARHPLETFSGCGNQRVEADGARIDGDGAVGTHRINDQSAAVFGDDGRDLRQRIEDAGARLAVHLSDMRDRWIRGQCGVDAHRIRRFLLAMREHHGLAPQIAQDPHDALAVAAVVRHQHLAGPRHQRAEGRFDG